MTPLQRLITTILLPKIFRKTNLVILEAADSTYALIQILTTQNYTDTDLCKKFFKPLFVCYSLSLIFSAHTHHSTFACFSLSFGGNFKYILNSNNSITTQNRVYKAYIKSRYLYSLSPLRFFGERSLLTNAVSARLVFSRSILGPELEYDVA